MTTRQLVLREIKKISDPLLEEVLDFVLFLENKNLGKRMQTALAAESSLKKDWLKTEEEKAWQNL